MHKVKIAVCVEEQEYRNRFVRCLIKHYREQVELHIYDSGKQLLKEGISNQELCLFSGEREMLFALSQVCPVPLICLYDSKEFPQEAVDGKMEGGIYFVEKYQEVNNIMEEVLTHISDEVRSIRQTGHIPDRTKLMAVYSLSDNEYQLPFAATLGAILGDAQKVLLVDLQENSGFSQIMDQDGVMGMEEVLLMAEEECFSKNRISSCIGHKNGMDFIYPMVNTECLCEVNAAIYLKMFAMLSEEMDYQVLILNLGTRFQGFGEILNHCSQIYLMKKNGGLGQWREYEFMEELKRKGYSGVLERMISVELPLSTYPIASFERLIEQWKWSELGDMIRGMTSQVAVIG